MTTREVSRPTTLESPFPGLVASPPAELPFARDVAIRAFLLERDHGNVLVYSAGTVPDVADELERLGGVQWQYLNHWHEAMFGVDRIAERFGAPVVVHRADQAEVFERSRVEPVTFWHEGSIGEGFDIVPTPGHTPGATAFLWEHGEHRFLFTGDSLYLRDGEWVAAVLASSDRRRYLESLDVLRGLDFDVLVPWAATAGDPFFARTDPADARRRLGKVIDRIWSGSDS